LQPHKGFINDYSLNLTELSSESVNVVCPSDANRGADPPPPRSRFEDLDFDSLLKQAQRGMQR